MSRDSARIPEKNMFDFTWRPPSNKEGTVKETGKESMESILMKQVTKLHKGLNHNAGKKLLNKDIIYSR